MIETGSTGGARRKYNKIEKKKTNKKRGIQTRPQGNVGTKCSSHAAAGRKFKKMTFAT